MLKVEVMRRQSSEPSHECDRLRLIVCTRDHLSVFIANKNIRRENTGIVYGGGESGPGSAHGPASWPGLAWPGPKHHSTLC